MMSEKKNDGYAMDYNTEYEISDDVLHNISLGTATKSGQSFFVALVEHAAKALNADMVIVTECITPDRSEVRTLAHWFKGKHAEGFNYNVAEFPCANVVKGQIYIQTANLMRDYPEEDDGMDSYIGIPLVSSQGKVLGHLAVLTENQIEKSPKGLTALRIIAARATVELERLQAESNRSTRAAFNRLAHDIHNSVLQTLWSAKLLTDVIPSLWERNPESATKRLAQLQQLNQKAIQEVQALLEDQSEADGETGSDDPLPNEINR